MTDAPTHILELRGHVRGRLLYPFLDDFRVAPGATGVTRLSGVVRDISHLHGLVAYLASINVELISITPIHVPPTRSTS